MAEGARDAVSREFSRIEEDCEYSAKRHFNAQALWNGAHYLIGVPTVVLAAIAGATATNHHETTASVTAVVAAILAGLNTFLNPYKRASMHSASGNKYLSIRNRARVVREIDVASGQSIDALIKQVKQLGSERDRLNEESPPTPWIAFVLARRGITAGETTYRIDQR